MRPLCYPQTDIFVVCFSVISPASHANITSTWIPELTHHAPHVPIVLVGTKVDMREDKDTLAELARLGKAPLSYVDGQ